MMPGALFVPLTPHAMTRKRFAIAAAVLAAAGLAVLVRLAHPGGDGWQSTALPQILAQDGNRANVVLVDRDSRLVALLATGVTWPPAVSMGPAEGGWAVTVSAAGHAARAHLAGHGPALLVALDRSGAERFRLDEAGFDALVSAVGNAHTADPWAPLDSLSVVDVVRKSYAGPDRQRLLRTLAAYRTIVLTPAEREALSGRHPGTTVPTQSDRIGGGPGQLKTGEAVTPATRSAAEGR